MKKTAIAVSALGALMLAGSALAKLPPLSDEAKLKADETKLKTAWADKVAAYKLCMRQDKVAAQYQKAKGSKPVAAGTPCQDPGAFVAPTAAAPAASAPMLAAAPATQSAMPAKPAAMPARK
jgi:hypothetical protein